MKRAELKILSRIYANLKSGKKYGYHVSGRDIKYPYDQIVISKIKSRDGRDLFEWCHYGSSANRATFDDLKWLITTIFKMDPSEFENKYAIVD